MKFENMHLYRNLYRNFYRKRKKCRRPYLRVAASSPVPAAAIADLGGLQESHCDKQCMCSVQCVCSVTQCGIV